MISSASRTSPQGVADFSVNPCPESPYPMSHSPVSQREPLRRVLLASLLASLLALSAGCSTATEDTDTRPQTCMLAAGVKVDFAKSVGCTADFELLASEPADASIPGARSVKTVIDRIDGAKLYFQNSVTFPIHHAFAQKHLSGKGLPLVGPLAQFNQFEYFSPDRRFLLGAVTHYAGPDVWVYEVSPYDTASAEMIATAYHAIASKTYFGDKLYFHPTSIAVQAVAAKLPASVKVISTDELFAGIDYQPLNIATGVGRLTFLSAQQAEHGPVYFRDLVVLDAVPNDIGVVAGIITAQLQTPLAHINVLSQNRGTPNMALRSALDNPKLAALAGKWVELKVGPFDWQIREVTQEEADAWWQAHKPTAVQVPAMNTATTALTNIEDVLDLSLGLGPALAKAIPAFGGKASHYGAFSDMGVFPVGSKQGQPIVPVPKAFAVPLAHYRAFMHKHGFDAQVEQLIADPKMTADPVYRDAKLKALRAEMVVAPVDLALMATLTAKLNAEYPGVRMRFRSSTNAEDLDGFTGAGLYTSKSGQPGDASSPVDLAMKKVWASMWNSRAWQERAWRSIDHRAVGMALLVHRSFPDEEANGVALTGNIFDSSGAEPGFFINVQKGEASVVQPAPGVTVDSFIYHYDYPGQPQVFLSHSSLVAPGETVLTTAQTYRLGQALAEINRYYMPLYGKKAADEGRIFAMDVEFKFDGPPGGEPALFVKQSRPFGGGE